MFAPRIKSSFSKSFSVLSPKIIPIEPECAKFFPFYLEYAGSKADLENQFNSNLKVLNKTKSLSSFLSASYLMNRYKTQITDIKHIIKQKIAHSPIETMNSCSQYYFDQNSKLLRPLLVLMFSQLIEKVYAKSPKEDKIVQIAAIVEALHTSSLLHDDVIDESDKRRASESAHTRFGVPATVNSGINLILNSVKLLREMEDSAVLTLYSRAMSDLISGEFKQNFKQSDFSDIHTEFQTNLSKSYYKTSSIMANSLRMLAYVHKLEPKVEESLFKVGLHAGLAFQLADDLLDLKSNSLILGKPSFIDLKDNIVNSYLLFEIYEKKDERLIRLANEQNKSDQEISEIVRIVRNGTGIEKTRNLMVDHIKEAISHLDCICPEERRFKHFVRNVLLYLVNRIK